MPIPYGKQSVNLKDIFSMFKIMKSDYLTIGPQVDKFEQELCSFTNTKYAVAVSSGTSALHCAYQALELKSGDEIITSPISFVATASTAIHSGAKVKFADVEETTANINPDNVDSLINRNTVAVTTVDYAGNPGNIRRLNSLTQKNGLTLIQDAAHSLGSLYYGEKVGSMADITVFSFFPTKNITTGEGGAAVTNNSDFFSKVKKFKMHGLERNEKKFFYRDIGPWHQEVHSLGLNYRMTDFQAALGISQLARIQKFKNKRRLIFNRYQDLLKDVQDIKLPQTTPGADPMWHLYPIQVPAEVRKSLFNYLRAFGILVQVNYFPIYLHPAFLNLGYKKGLCPNAEKFYSSEISLPMHVNLTNRQITRIVKLIKQFFH